MALGHVFTPRSGRVWSVDQTQGHCPYRLSMHFLSGWAAGLFFQIMYWFTAILKSGSGAWTAALYYALSCDQVAKPMGVYC